MKNLSSFPSVLWTVAFLALAAMSPETRVSAADVPPALHPELEVLRPYVGRTWRGDFKNSTPEKPMVDIAKWERALNGQAIRVLHSINQGVYGGETLMTWDATKKTIVYHYFTTAGFMTTGTLRREGGKVISHEFVKGEAGGVAEVRATNELLPDGTMTAKSEYLKNGKWEPGHEIVYREDPKAEVVFK